MSGRKVDRLGELNPLQIAGLAVLSSAIVAGTVTALVRRFFHHGAHPDETADDGLLVPTSQPATAEPLPADVPQHFTEALIVPGITESGAEISEQDANDGRSPEGV